MGSSRNHKIRKQKKHSKKNREKNKKGNSFCGKTGKIIYLTDKEARAKAKTLQIIKGVNHRVYRCDFCKKLHLSTKKTRRRKRKNAENIKDRDSSERNTKR